jgi:dUTP pyrophosphatase
MVSQESKRGFEKISQEQWSEDANNDCCEYKDIKLPKRATSKSAGYDIFSTANLTLEMSEEALVPCGFKVYMQEDEVFKIFPRSGLGFKYFMRLANTIGIIDADYYNNVGNEGHCFVKIRNEGVRRLEIHIGDAIAQGIFSKFLKADNDETTAVRSGGIGSTSK